jgi:RND family efflux transporter MFP subunit
MKPRLDLIVLASLGFTAAAATLVLAGTARDPAAIPATTPALAVATAPVQLQDAYTLARDFTGRVEPRRSSTLGFELAGRLARVEIREGEAVARGQVLAALDTARLQAQREELLAALEEQRATLALATSTLARMRDVVERGGATRQELDEAREGRRAAAAGLTLIERRIDSIDVDLDKARLRAPYDGIVVRRLSDEGRVLAAGEPVLTLQEAARPEVRIGLAGRFVEHLVEGERYPLGWGGTTIAARLRAVLPLRAAGARTVDVLFDLERDVAGLRPGDLVTLELSEAVPEAGYWLPISALTEAERGLWGVYVTVQPEAAPPDGIAATHRVVRRIVEVLHQEGGRVYVRGALSDGEQVVSTGLHRLVPGQWVRQQPATKGLLASVPPASTLLP